MYWILKWLGFFVVRRLLFRYKVVVRGAEYLKGFDHGMGIILGHMAYPDPMIVSSQLARYGVFLRPVVYSKMYDKFKWIMHSLGGFRMPSTTDGSSDWKVWTIKRTVEEVTHATDHSVVGVYPSGRLKNKIVEELGGKSMVFDILRAKPGMPVLVVEIRGLWGDLFSRFSTDGERDLTWKERWSFIRKDPWKFFMRRTLVDIDIKRIDFPQYETAAELNAFLKREYQKRPDWIIPGREDWKIPVSVHARHAAHFEMEDLEPSVTNRVFALIAKEFKRDPAMIALDKNLVDDLGFDSMDTVTLMKAVEESFDVQVDEDVVLKRVADVVAAAQGLLSEVATHEHTDEPLKGWVVSKQVPRFPKGAQTIVDGYIKTSRYMGWNTVAIATQTGGVLTRWQMFSRAKILARIIRCVPEERVGVMLPPTPEAYITILAAFLARKVVVPLNWTGGAAALEGAIHISEAGTIYTAEKFLDKASIPLSEALISKIVTLEDVRAQMRMYDKVAGTVEAWIHRLMPWLFGAVGRAEDIAVFLFTSGTEKKDPKGVPHTHRSVLFDLEKTMDAFPARSGDVVLGMLPAFHSFGFTLGGLLSKVGGVTEVLEPDPRKSKSIVKAIHRFGVTVVPSTSDFIAGAIKAARSDLSKLATVRAFLAGGQPTPQSLVDYIINVLDKDFHNGYGTTETAPVISITRDGRNPIGIGIPLDGITVVILDRKTGLPVPDGTSGSLIVAGLNVFDGYVGSDEYPFIIYNGAKYYITGDIAYRHPTGNLVLTGREKEFLKGVGGEMISLAEIRTAFAGRFGVDENNEPIVAVGGKEIPGERPIIALYTRDVTITRVVANEVLKGAGVPQRAFITHVIQVERFTLTGIGKVKMSDLPSLDTMRALA